MKYYEVKGKCFFSVEDLTKLLAKSTGARYYKFGENELGNPITPEVKLDNSWIEINLFFQKEKVALKCAREQLNKSIDGGYVAIEKVVQKFRSPKIERRIIYKLKKENGKIIEVI